MAKSPPSAAGHFHAVKFYENRESLCRIVAEFLGEGLRRHEPALVIATPAHRDGIIHDLSGQGFDVEVIQRTGDLLMLDAADELDAFMRDGMPDPSLFRQRAGNVIEGLCRGRQNRTIRAYGEMVDVLWKNRQEIASIRLEMLWNKLAATQEFSLLCGYAMGNFYKDATLQAIHQQHSHVVNATGLTAKACRSTTLN
jgi:DcmR-like sensory protein